MKEEIIKSPSGLWYSHWMPTVQDSLNRVLIVCTGGSGEWSLYNSSDMQSEVIRVTRKNGFAQDAAAGEELPFHVISPLAIGKKNSQGQVQADHTLIAAEIGNIAKAVDVDYRFFGGLSQGGQTAAGFLFQAKTGTELSKNLPSSYLNADVFDGFFMFAGQAPMPTNPCAFPGKYVFMVHATGDTSIKVDNSFTMMRLLNECPERKDKIVANYYQKWTSPVSYLPKTFEGDPVNKLFIIPGGDHSTSWTEAYKWRGPLGTAGYEFRKWIETICIPKQQVDIPGKIVLRNGVATILFEDGTIKQINTI